MVSQVRDHHRHVIAEILVAFLLFLELFAQGSDLLLICANFFLYTVLFVLEALHLRTFSGYLVPQGHSFPGRCGHDVFFLSLFQFIAEGLYFFVSALQRL